MGGARRKERLVLIFSVFGSRFGKTENGDQPRLVMAGSWFTAAMATTTANEERTGVVRKEAISVTNGSWWVVGVSE